MSTAPGPIRVLMVEDDRDVVSSVREGLDPERFAIDHAGTIADGRRALVNHRYSVLLLDLGLPDGSGLELAKAVRTAGSELPIVMLTALSAVEEKLDGFRFGADDYLCKPFEVPELEARINAVLRRSRRRQPHLLNYADVELDLVRRVVRRGDFEATLSARELDLLAYLMQRPEQLLPRAKLLEEVWGEEAEGESNVLNVYINYLRNKLERGIRPRLIHTVRGVGYVLSEVEPEQIADPL